MPKSRPQKEGRSVKEAAAKAARNRHLEEAQKNAAGNH
jgi:hypothetical protein